MTPGQTPPRWFLAVSRTLLRWRLGRRQDAGAEQYLGDLSELWAGRRAAGCRTLLFRGARDLMSLLLHVGAEPSAIQQDAHWGFLAGVHTMWHDMRYSFRLMRRQPVFSAMTLVTLTLGIAVSTGIFTSVDRLLWRPLPFPAADRLVLVANPAYSFGDNRMNPARGMIELPVFAGVGLYAEGGVNVDGFANPVRATATVASPGFFTALAVPAHIGRPYTVEDDVATANALVVISDGFWRRYLGGDPNVLERRLSINRRPFRIMAVMPEGFSFPGTTELWLPSGADLQVTGQGFAPMVIARIKTGVTFDQAQAALDAFDLERGAPEREDQGPRLTGLQDSLTSQVRPTLLLLAISVGLVLLVATTNVAGLLLARVARRQSEFVLRRALGASRRRLIQFMAIDAGCHAVVAGAAGTALSVLVLQAFSVFGRQWLPGAAAIGVDSRMLWIALGVSACSALLFGLAPGLAVTARPAAHALRGGVTDGRGWRWTRHGLVVGQVACALILLTVTTATTATMRRLASVDLAFDGRGVLGLDVTLPTATYEGPQPASLFVDQALAQLRALPGVASVGATGMLPGDVSTGIGVTLGVPGQPRADDAPPRFATFLSATPGYFASMGIEVVEGRPFTEHDRRGSPPVAILSESTARLLWPDGRSPIGLQVESGFGTMASAEVVGVVRNVSLRGPEVPGRPMHFYRPIAQHPPFGNVSFALKTTGDPLAMAPAVRAAIAAIDPTLPVYNLRLMADIADGFLATRRLAIVVLGGFALLTLVLAGVGLYGVLAQVIEQQTREIGIRVALGADPHRVRRGIVGVALRLAMTGIVIGAAGSKMAASLLAAYVPRMDAVAWPMMAAHAGVILVISLAASWVPARRASAIDPIIALRD